MIISDLNYLETAANDVNGSGFGEIALFTKQINFNKTKQAGQSVAITKSFFVKDDLDTKASVYNYNSTYQYNEVN